jgi:hypothetical protein
MNTVNKEIVGAREQLIKFREYITQIEQVVELDDWRKSIIIDGCKSICLDLQNKIDEYEKVGIEYD